MTLDPGTMTVQVLEDGTLRVETGDMGGVAHQAADAFLKELQRLLGGATDIKAVVKHAHGHTHHHDHSDGHDHGHTHH